MTASNLTIELDAKTARAITEYAAGLGLSVPEFLQKHFAGTNGASPIGNAEKWLDEISEGTESLPPLPHDFSTRDMYTEHD